MALGLEVAETFGPAGVLSRTIEHFVPRDGQTDMARAVAKAIDATGVLVVEASTGVGKTFAYLVPALLSGERVLLSTATKALQDQLFGRDLPRLVQALGLPVSTALLKGRGSYLCIHRMTLARHEHQTVSRGDARALGRIEQWSQVTRTGDLAELPGLDEKSALIPAITSTRDNCLGSQCPAFRSCHVNQARRQALAADVVVINHHLFFADLAVRESGVAELLPTVRIAIFDEAHQLNETGVQFLGRTLTTGQLLDFCRDVLAAGLQFARGLVDWQKVVGECEMATRELRLCVGAQPSGTKLRWTDLNPEGVDGDSWNRAIDELLNALRRAMEVIDTLSEIAPDFQRLHARASELAARLQLFSALGAAGHVRWLEVGQQLRLVESPLVIAEAVKARMTGAPGASGKTWIFTSATLGNDDELTWFTQPCGLDNATIVRVPSPFDYAAQAALYVPGAFPAPADPAHAIAVATSAARWARRLGGRTMVLTTTLRALRLIGDSLTQFLVETGELDVLVQGAMPKRALVERFRQGANEGRKGCVMVASQSFWEGLDVPGDSLQLLIIDKLPFPPPNDPMAQARSKALESEGKNSFNAYFLPEAAVALKQGAGRLIRRESDKGILVVCDNRLAAMGYGKRLMKALPPMKRLWKESEMEDQIDDLTRTGTKAFQPS